MKVIYRTQITGLSHHNYAFVAKTIEVGTILKLQRDVGNRYDEHAIKVLTEAGDQIGWMSNKIATGGKSVVAALMDHGLELTCGVISHDTKKSALDERLYVAIALVDKE